MEKKVRVRSKYKTATQAAYLFERPEAFKLA